MSIKPGGGLNCEVGAGVVLVVVVGLPKIEAGKMMSGKNCIIKI